MDYIKLNSGALMPALGYGTFKIAEEDAERCVCDALEAGYRKIDTAIMYGNEAGVGKAISGSGIKRSGLFVTTKIWTDCTTVQKTLDAVFASLDRLKTDYLDLLLIHWPVAANAQMWRAMEKLTREGVLRAIGLSNFKEHHINELMEAAEIAPALNQIELHPWFQQPALRRFCADKGMIVEAWSPLMRGKVVEVDELVALGEKYGKSVAQIVLRYDIQSGMSVVAKTMSKQRMAENLDIFGFSLSAGDMDAIARLDRGARQYRDPDSHGF